MRECLRRSRPRLAAERSRLFPERPRDRGPTLHAWRFDVALKDELLRLVDRLKEEDATELLEYLRGLVAGQELLSQDQLDQVRAGEEEIAGGDYTESGGFCHESGARGCAPCPNAAQSSGVGITSRSPSCVGHSNREL